MAALFQREQALKELEAGLSGSVVKSNVMFQYAAEKFLEWYKAEHDDKHPNTAKRAATSLVSLRYFFNGKNLRDITPGHLDRYKTFRKKEHCVEDVTLRHDLHNLSSLMQYAKRQGWCDANPVEEIDIPSDKDAVRINFISPEAEKKFFAAAKQRSKDLYDVARVMILQGPRPEEVMKMKKTDIREGKMHVWGKSRASDRWLLMTDESKEILTCRLHSKGPWLFPSPSKLNEGGHIKSLQTAITDVFHALLSAEPEFSRFTLYDFRHTFATRAATGLPPMPLPILAAILGHGSLSSVYKYLHPNQVHMDEAMAINAVRYQSKSARASG